MIHFLNGLVGFIILSLSFPVGLGFAEPSLGGLR